MTLVLVEVANEAAVEILRQNKDIQVVGIVTKLVDAAPAELPATGSPRKWAGALAGANAEDWDKHLQEIRNEWDRAI